MTIGANLTTTKKKGSKQNSFIYLTQAKQYLFSNQTPTYCKHMLVCKPVTIL